MTIMDQLSTELKLSGGLSDAFFVGQKWTQGIRRLIFLHKNGHLFLPMDVLLCILA